MTGAQPAGTVTLVFTDIEGSTRLLHELGVDRYREALAEHRRIVRDACARHHGYEVDYEGDAFFYAFASAQAAVTAVSEAMTGLGGGPIRIRVGIHTGEPSLDPPKYVGLDVHRAARIMSAAHGGQVLLSPTTVGLLQPDSVQLEDLGQHRLKDLSAPIPLAQLVIAGLETRFPPLKTLYRSNLPTPATPFLGRDQELAAVVALLTDPNTRLLTLTGPGGTGKTRLAVQAAAEASDHYPDGITWIPLAPLRDPALTVPTIAQAVAVNERPGEELTSTLVTALHGKRHLLLLDNAEHLLPQAADHVAALLRGCPSLSVLLTSRERVQIGAETTWPVPPLSEQDGEALFRARAEAVGVTLSPNGAVAELCRRLDELPLALELAAARTVVFSPAQLLERLGQRLDLLKAGRDADPRQQTLRATIDWSYQLLDEEEQRVYRALSMFAGGCGFETAESVAGADPDTLQSLIDKSLVRRRDTDDGPRYWMLETIREHASDALQAADEDGRVFEGFLRWLDGVVGGVDEYWVDRDQLEWFDALEEERENLMQGLAECRTRGRVDDEVRLLLAAFEFFDARGPWAPTAELLRGLPTSDDRLEARVRYALGFFAYRAGRLREAIAEFHEAHARATRAQDDSIAARALAHVAAMTAMAGDDEGTSASLAEEAVGLARRSGDRSALAHALNCLGIVVAMPDAERARDLYSEAASLAAEIGDDRNAVIFGTNLIRADLALRRTGEAADAAMRTVGIIQRLGDLALEAGTLDVLALAYLAVGERDSARLAVRRIIELMSEWRDEILLVEALTILAMASAAEEPHRAIVLWAAAARARTTMSIPLSPEMRPYVDEILEPLRAVDGFDGLWQAGGELELDEAIERGLG